MKCSCKCLQDHCFQGYKGIWLSPHCHCGLALTKCKCSLNDGVKKLNGDMFHQMA